MHVHGNLHINYYRTPFKTKGHISTHVICQRMCMSFGRAYATTQLWIEGLMLKHNPLMVKKV